MKKSSKAEIAPDQALDFAQLLGFGNLAETITESVDFQDETMAARLGAKVSIVKSNASAPETKS